MTPFVVKKDGDSIPVPCGKCPECLARRASGWSFRLMQEERYASSAHFITLTYDTDHVPISERGFMTLCKKDVQDFMKRLRKRSAEKLKYYACGEYGTHTWRPHYHIILFNAKIEDVEQSWTDGAIHCGTVTGASVGYTLKYMSKPKRVPAHANDDRQPEFSLMSKGLGKSYLTPAMREWHEADLLNRMYINYDGDKKMSMPRYYKEKIYTEADREAISIKAAQKAYDKTLEHYREMAERHGEKWSKVQVEIDLKKFRDMYKNSLKNRNL